VSGYYQVCAPYRLGVCIQRFFYTIQ